jgi:prepilin-type N-terminal cleavage/methylation domain-containing protein
MMEAAGRQHGFTLIEVLVAVLLLSMMALSLTRTLMVSQRARATSERWTQAAQLAAEGIEQLRAGHPLGPIRVPGEFSRRAEVAAWNGHAGLVRLVVTVSWHDGAAAAAAPEFRLSTLVRR